AVRGDRARWISLPPGPDTGRTPPDPLFSLGIEDVDLPAAVVPALIMEAEDVDATVDPRLLAHAEEVVAEPTGVAGVLEERVSERDVRVGKSCDARLGELLRVDRRLEPAHVDQLGVLAIEVGGIARPATPVQLSEPEASLHALQIFRVEARKHSAYRRIQVVPGLVLGRSHPDHRS